ncbi:MAG TPA: adenylate kinase [Acidimicrobiales bacterium]|nr:adenylate kinase [Acidimicrobiales bacterium]
MTNQLNLVVLGKQGAGKGTQSQLLCDKYGLAHISTGDILRAAVQAGSALGKEVQSVLDSGQLVSDDLVNKLVEDRFKADDAKKGGVLDGFPRNIGQAEALEKILGVEGLKLCISIDLPNELVLARLSSRRVCQECGTTYKETDPAAISGTCEVCGGDVVQRSDDKPEAIQKRLETFERDTVPLLSFYQKKGILETVNGDESVDEVAGAINAVLKARGLV